jgi:hypothetical protein
MFLVNVSNVFRDHYTNQLPFWVIFFFLHSSLFFCKFIHVKLNSEISPKRVIVVKILITQLCNENVTT